MGTKKKQPQQLPFEQNYTQAFIAPPETAASNAVRDFKFDDTVASAGAQSAFGQNARRIEEGSSGYQSSGNAILDNRIKQLGLIDNSNAYSRYVSDANAQRQAMKYGQTMDYARLMSPQLQTTRVSGYQTQMPQGGSFWGDLLRAGAQVGSAAILACDPRLKESFTPISTAQALNVVTNTPVTGFNYKNDALPMIGWDATKVRETLPEAIQEYGDAALLGINLMPMMATQWAAVQELARIVTAQSAEIVALRQELIKQGEKNAHQ